MKRHLLTLFLSVALAACATPAPEPVATTSTSTHGGWGVIDSIDVVEAHSNTPGIGAIAGAVVGGIAGSQFGSGRGATAATIAGAAGGGYIGNKIEQQRAAGKSSYRVNVRMDDGSYQSVRVNEASPAWRSGDRVRVMGDGSLTRY